MRLPASWGASVAGVALLGSFAVPTAVGAQPVGRVVERPGVRILSAQQIGSREVVLTISTPAFATPTHVDVDLPVGYRSHPGKRWPTVYVLAGISNTYKSFNHVVDGLRLARPLPAVVVSPNGDSGWWSNWYNRGKFGAPQYETFVIHQLIPLIDKRFRTIPKRSERAIAGISMGGYGAMMLAAQHPDLFADAASLSGAVDTDFEPISTVLSLSPELQGAKLDAIYGSQATQEIRWRGHNPTGLANNLRGMRLQVRSANGIPAPGLGENLLSADSASCVIEAGVHRGSQLLDTRLNRLGIKHEYRDYGPGCHSRVNFIREIRAAFADIKRQLADPPAKPRTFSFQSIDRSFRIWGWTVRAGPARALEWMYLRHVNRAGLTITGSGRTTVTTAPLFRGVRRVQLRGAVQKSARPDRRGRITFAVDLGPADRKQELTAGAQTTRTSRVVRFATG